MQNTTPTLTGHVTAHPTDPHNYNIEWHVDGEYDCDDNCLYEAYDVARVMEDVWDNSDGTQPMTIIAPTEEFAERVHTCATRIGLPSTHGRGYVNGQLSHADMVFVG